MPVRAKIRFDFKSEPKGRKYFWERYDPREEAKELREKKVTLFRNLPFQGLNVTDFNANQEVYLVADEESHREVAYAPMELTVEAESLEDLMQLTLQDEFRRIKVIEPPEILLSTADVERLLFKVTNEYREEF